MRLLTIGDDWLEYAKLLPVGQSRRAAHDCGRGGKLALTYGNSPKGYWVKCYRCGFKDFRTKEHVQYRRPVAQQTRLPDDCTPIINILSERAYLLRKTLEQHRLLPYLTMLKVSPQYGRLYLPDDSNSFCGLDYTGTAYAWWHSPTGATLAHMGKQGVPLHVYGEAPAYLDAVKRGESALFLPAVSHTSLMAAAALALMDDPESIHIWNHPSAARIQKELAVTGVPVKTGSTPRH